VLALLFIAMFALVLLGMDIAFVLIFCPILVILLTNMLDIGVIPMEVIAQYLFGGADSFSLTAIPLFILAGEIMNQGGLTQRLVQFAKKIVGHVSGGIGQASVLLNICMAGISGSSVADCTATGSILIPSMKKEGYTPEKSAAIIAAASTVAPIIPPSIPLIIIGATAGLSIGQLFLAGIIPGIIMALAMMIYIYFYAKAKKIPKDQKEPFRAQVAATKKAILPLGMPIIILGSILLGIASPTEAAVLAVIYSIIVSFFVYKELSLKTLYNAFKNSAISTGMIMFVVAAGVLFGWVATYFNIAMILKDFLLSFGDNPYLVLIIINIILLFLGMVLETIPIILLMTPVLFPIASSLGIDPIHLAIVMTLNLMIGLITPPIGLHLFITAAIAKVSIFKVIKASFPFFVVLCIVLLIITFIPGITLYLPNFLN
jgi:tripartite ATP-independent transporter DctM subunit